MRSRRSAVLALVLVTSCTSEESGYADGAQQQVDDLARALLPAAVTDLDVKVFAGRASFLSCGVSGWRYQGDANLLGSSLAGPAVLGRIRALLEQQGLTVEERADGSVLGTAGTTSVLVGALLGPTGRAFRVVTFKDDCKRYSDKDVDLARAAAGTDYLALVPEDARYVP